jgi:hypothetical protein
MFTPLLSCSLNLTDILVFSSPRDVEALNILLDYIPEYPQELKATLSDSQLFLRQTKHLKQKGTITGVLGLLGAACCKFNCVEKAKKVLCKG